jgi:hypothetical protein
MKPFIDQHRERLGVEPICKALQVAPSAYWREAARSREPTLCPPRRQRDAALVPEIERVWENNMRVYGADKVWQQLRREHFAVARCTVERLMRRQGLRGVIRGKSVRTTVPDAKAMCPLDRVNRQFKAERPNELWVSDFSAPCRRGLQRRRKEHDNVSEPSWLIHDRQLKRCLAPVEAGRKGAAKLGRLPTAGCHAQSSLNCTERSRIAATRRATARSMVRQRSVRWKPLYLLHRPARVAGSCGAIRLGLMFPSGGCALPHSTMDFLPQPSSGATRGRARHLRT